MDVIYTLAPLAEATGALCMSNSRLLSLRGCQCYVQPLGENAFRILRICSSRPSDFLRPDLFPGRIVRL